MVILTLFAAGRCVRQSTHPSRTAAKKAWLRQSVAGNADQAMVSDPDTGEVVAEYPKCGRRCRTPIDSFDFAGIEPVPGATVRWVPAEPRRRIGTRGIGRLMSVDPDGVFRVGYRARLGGAHKTRIIRVPRERIVGYVPPQG